MPANVATLRLTIDGSGAISGVSSFSDAARGATAAGEEVKTSAMEVQAAVDAMGRSQTEVAAAIDKESAALAQVSTALAGTAQAQEQFNLATESGRAARDAYFEQLDREVAAENAARQAVEAHMQVVNAQTRATQERGRAEAEAWVQSLKSAEATQVATEAEQKRLASYQKLVASTEKSIVGLKEELALAQANAAGNLEEADAIIASANARRAEIEVQRLSIGRNADEIAQIKLIVAEKQRLVTSLQQTQNASSGTALTNGKLRSSLTSLLTTVAGVPGPVGQVASSLSSMAIGGVVTVGLLAGLTAISYLYEKLTANSRKLREETERLTKSLSEQAQEQAGLKALSDRALLLKQVESAQLSLSRAQARESRPVEFNPRTDLPVSRGYGPSLADAEKKAAEAAEVLAQFDRNASAQLIGSTQALAVARAKATGDLTKIEAAQRAAAIASLEAQINATQGLTVAQKEYLRVTGLATIELDLQAVATEKARASSDARRAQLAQVRTAELDAAIALADAAKDYDAKQRAQAAKTAFEVSQQLIGMDHLNAAEKERYRLARLSGDAIATQAENTRRTEEVEKKRLTTLKASFDSERSLQELVDKGATLRSQLNQSDLAQAQTALEIRHRAEQAALKEAAALDPIIAANIEIRQTQLDVNQGLERQLLQRDVLARTAQEAKDLADLQYQGDQLALALAGKSYEAEVRAIDATYKHAVAALDFARAQGTISEGAYQAQLAQLKHNQSLEQTQVEYKALGGIADQVLSGLSSATDDLFRDLLSGGTDAFAKLAESILGTVQQLAIDLAKIGLLRALVGGDTAGQSQEELVKQLSGKLTKVLADVQKKIGKEGVGAIAGAAVGFGVGSSTGSPLAGGLSGAATGLAVGGPVGAIVGGIGGIVGGLLGHANSIKQIQKTYDTATKNFERSLDEFVKGLTGVYDGYIGQQNRLKDAVAAQGDQALRVFDLSLLSRDLEKFGVDYADLSKILKEEGVEGIKRVRDLFAGSVKSTKDIDILIAELEKLGGGATEAADKLAAAESARQTRISQDLESQLSQAKLRGTEDPAAQRALEDRLQQLAQERRYIEATAELYTEQQLATLRLLDAEETLATQRERAAEDQQAQAAAERTARDFSLDLLQREAALSQDADQAKAAGIAILAARQQDEAAAAQKLLDAGTLTQEQFERLAAVMSGEMIAALNSTSGAIDQIATAAQILSDNASALSQQFDVFGTDLDEQVRQLGELYGFQGKSIEDLQALYTKVTPGEAISEEAKTLNDEIARFITLQRQADAANTVNAGTADTARTARATSPTGNVINGNVAVSITINTTSNELNDPERSAEAIATRVNRILGGRLSLERRARGLSLTV
jgi:hypothetical protein